MPGGGGGGGGGGGQLKLKEIYLLFNLPPRTFYGD